ncbi:cytochrome P450 [Cercophora samala]|uniref:Cytochrome P450 n=1 Tax=Cercophora samala TaxID=330535 RepID=A0AA39YNX5_9PEZI|nr:cytochrome P450 [Cercophora samala]
MAYRGSLFESQGKGYEILTPESRYVFVSSPSHIKELLAVPDSVFSLYAASRQLLQPIFTMHNFNWLDKEGTKGGNEGGGFVRAVRVCLTNTLPTIVPSIRKLVSEELDRLLPLKKCENGSKTAAIYPLILRLTVLSNAEVIFGKELARNELFIQAAKQYIEQVFLGAELIRLLPSWMAPVASRALRPWLNAQHIVYETLTPIAARRLREQGLAENGILASQDADCIQWIMESLPTGRVLTPQRLVHETMAIWFGSIHAVAGAITIALQDLCLHPEYLDPLRKEIDTQYLNFERIAQGLPLLDSFLKESARLTPTEALSTRRYAVEPHTFSDGTHLNRGDWACTPLIAINRIPEFYPNPEQFSGFRFAPPQLLDSLSIKDEEGLPKQDTPSKLVDTDHKWLMFGTGRQACPGRFYAAAAAKVIMSQIISKYDMRMVDKDAKRWWSLRSTIVLREDVMVEFTPRVKGNGS